MELQELAARVEALERRLEAMEGEGGDMISPAKADARLGVSKGTTLAAIIRGDLPGHVKPGGKRYRVRVADLERWVSEW